MRCSSSVVLVMSLAAPTAFADVITLTASEKGAKFVCEGTTLAKEKEPSSVSLLSETETMTGLKVCLNGDQDCHEKELKDNKGTITFEKALHAGDAGLKMQAIGKAVAVTCAVKDPKVGKPEGAPAAMAPLPSSTLNAIDIQAEVWLSSEAGRTALDRVAPANAVRLIHLPSGGAAALSANSAREDRELQIFYVFDSLTVQDTQVNVTTCETPVNFRVLGDSLKIGQDKGGGEERVPVFGVILLGPLMRCGAGVFGYNLAIGSAAPRAFALILRPVYAISTVFAYGFDFGEISTFSVQSKKIVRQTDSGGPRFYAGFAWHHDGLDEQDLTGRRCDPFVAFNLSAPTENLLVGFKVAARRGIGIAIAASVRKSVILDGVVEGGTYEADTPVPTKKVWNRDSVGLYVGFNFDTTALLGIKKVFGAK